MSAGAMASPRFGARAVLRIADFRRVWLAQGISDVGDGLTNLTLLIVVTRLTGSTAALAAMAIALAVPDIVVGPVAGVFVDRWDRRRVMLASDLLRALIVLGFIVAVSSGQLVALYGLALAEASVSAFFAPARMALVPRVVPAEGLMAANSLNQMTRIIATVAGGASAGVLIGIGDVAWPAFSIDAITFVASFLLVFGVSAGAGRVPVGLPVGGGRPAAPSVRRELADGIAIVARSRVLLATLIGAGVSMLGIGAINVLFVPFLLRDLSLPVTWLGVIDGAQTASMVLAAGIVAALAARIRPTTIVVLSLAGIGLLIAFTGAAQSVWQVAALLFGVGWFVTPLNASLLTIVQTHAEDTYRGRVSSTLHSVMAAANVLSMGLAGVFGDLLGPRIVFAGGGILILGAAGLAASLYRRGAGVRPEWGIGPHGSEVIADGLFDAE